MNAFLAFHSITNQPRPVRRHNKTGIVERKHRTLKVIMLRIQGEASSASDATLLSRATFLSNIFSGSKVLSSFELARGYTPSLLGIPPRMVAPDLFQAAREQAATRAIQRLLKGRVPSTVPPRALSPGTPILYFYRSSKASEPIEWRPGRIISAEAHRVLIFNKSGARSFVAYEDIRIRPSSPLARELMEGTLDEVFEASLDDAKLPIDQDGAIIDPGEADAPNNSAIPLEDSESSDDEAVMPNDHGHPEPDADDNVDMSHALSAGLFDNHAFAMEDEEPPRNPAIEAAARDIGDYADRVTNAKDPDGKVLTSSKQAVLRTIKNRLGSKQVTAAQLSFAPAWVLEEAIRDELGDNWSGAYELVDYESLPADANVIASHVVFKVKEDQDGSLRLKARLVLHGNRDKDRFKVRRDSAAAELLVVRLVLCIASILGFSIATADVKGAYMQSGSIRREIFVRTFEPIRMPRGKLWRLTRLPYGIVDAGRQWLCAVEGWMKDEYKLSQVFGILQLFAQRDEDGRICMLVAKVVDDFLIVGRPSHIDRFLHQLGKKFTLGAINRSSSHSFLGGRIARTQDGSVRFSMPGYINRASPIHVPRSRRTDLHAKADARETSEYRSLAGVLVFLGQAVLPQASMVASKMQQKLGDLRIVHLLDANKMLAELKQLSHGVVYKAPARPSEITLCTFSDASHGSMDETYGQSGSITGLRITQDGGHPTLYHCFAWSSSKQRQISYSSFGAEIIAAAMGDDRGFDIKGSFLELFPHRPIKHELLVDSKSLYETITTLHQPREYRLRKTVARMRDAFESKELNVVRWVPGELNYADALTKRSPVISERLNAMLLTGRWDLDLNRTSRLDADEWC